LGKVLEVRPYWGEGGTGERIVLTVGTEQDAVAAFSNGMSANQNLTVLQVERVQNATLWSSYAAKRHTMMQRPGATESCERAWLYHGTDHNTVLKIVSQGFNRNFGFKEINENALTMYGKGFYVAVNDVSTLPTRRVTDTASPTALENTRCLRAGCSWGGTAKARKTNLRRMFGKGLNSMTQQLTMLTRPRSLSRLTMRRRTRNTSSPSKRTLINSLMNRVQGRTIFVVQHRNQTYPSYLIACQASTKRDLIHGQ